MGMACWTVILFVRIQKQIYIHNLVCDVCLTFVSKISILINITATFCIPLDFTMECITILHTFLIKSCCLTVNAPHLSLYVVRLFVFLLINPCCLLAIGLFLYVGIKVADLHWCQAVSWMLIDRQTRYTCSVIENCDQHFS